MPLGPWWHLWILLSLLYPLTCHVEWQVVGSPPSGRTSGELSGLSVSIRQVGLTCLVSCSLLALTSPCP